MIRSALLGLVIITIGLEREVFAECPISLALSCMTQSAALTEFYSRVFTGDTSLSPEELGDICQEWPAVQACIETAFGRCKQSERPNILMLTSYIHYMCNTGTKAYGNITNCMVKGIVQFRMPGECQQQLRNASDDYSGGFSLKLDDSLGGLVLQLIVKSRFDEVNCIVMNISRACAVSGLENMCGPGAGAYWNGLSTQALREMSGSDNPDCAHFRLSTEVPSTTTSKAVNAISRVTPRTFMEVLIAASLWISHFTYR